MSNVQFSENSKESNLEKLSTVNNGSSTKEDYGMRENSNGVKKEDATDKDINDSNQVDKQTNSLGNFKWYSDIPFGDSFYSHSSKNAIRERLIEDDEDATINDIDDLERHVEEKLNTEISNESDKCEYKIENKIVQEVHESDKAVRENLGISDDDATANDFASMSISSSSDVSIPSVTNSLSKVCKCTENTLCSMCLNKYASDFNSSIKRSPNFSNELNTDRKRDIITEEITSNDVNKCETKYFSFH